GSHRLPLPPRGGDARLPLARSAPSAPLRGRARHLRRRANPRGGGVPRVKGGHAPLPPSPQAQRCGCGVSRRAGFSALKPLGNFLFSSSGSVSDGTITQSPPCFQLTGVATWYLSVSWSESRTRRISLKSRPVLAGQVIIARTLRFGSMKKTERTVRVSLAFGCIIP